MIEQLQEELRTFINPEKASFFPRFFKTGPGEYAEGDKFLGVTVPHQRALAKKYHKRLTMAESLRLLKSEWHEERLIALFVFVLKFQKGEPQTKTNIFDLYIENTQYINNWDLVDASADKIVGAWLYDSPYKMQVLSKLAESESLWERRITMIATFYYIKQGRADEAVDIATALLHDQHDLIQKAVGWMLREVGKRCDQQLLTLFLDEHAATMPRTTLRYAIEHLPAASKAHYMQMKNR